MNKNQAAHVAVEGRKVKRPSFVKGDFIIWKNGQFQYYSDRNKLYIPYAHFETADDWEVVPEPDVIDSNVLTPGHLSAQFGPPTYGLKMLEDGHSITKPPRRVVYPNDEVVKVPNNGGYLAVSQEGGLLMGIDMPLRTLEFFKGWSQTGAEAPAGTECYRYMQRLSESCLEKLDPGLVAAVLASGCYTDAQKALLQSEPESRWVEFELEPLDGALCFHYPDRLRPLFATHSPDLIGFDGYRYEDDGGAWHCDVGPVIHTMPGGRYPVAMIDDQVHVKRVAKAVRFRREEMVG